MSQSPKVVQLNPGDGTGRRAHSLPPILHSVRQSAKKHLTDLVQFLFNNADDALFEMADRSRNDADQHMFFDSMREIRLHRRQITTDFVAKFSQGFDALFAETKAPEPREEEDFEATVDSLSLVKNDDLEMSVAISGIVSKITSQYSLQVMQLTKRIDVLCTARTVTERLNPMGPHRLGEAFVDALGCLDIDIKVRIIILKLFERFVMERLGPCYEEANRLLAEAGVLADLRSVLKKSSEQRGRPPARTGDGAGAAGGYGPGGAGGGGSGVSGAHASGSVTSSAAWAGGSGGAGGGAYGASGTSGYGASEGGFTMLQQLLAGHRDGGGVAASAGIALGGPIMTTPQLITVLGAVQSEEGGTPIDLERAPIAIDLRQLLLRKAEDVIGASLGSMGQADDDTVNLVGMLFDYILNDRNLAIPMKALIGRLQIPILRVAIIDKTFFGKTSHPARQLLNELSSAGIGWSSSAELKRDALYNKIESIVLRVLNNLKDDLAIFGSLVTELREFVRGDNRRTQIVEQRVKETESGKARSIAAKHTVERLINQKASGMRLPPDAGRFISDTWSRVMVYVCVRHGTDSPDWQAVIETFDDLVWSLQPLDDVADIERRERGTAHLLERLEQGMRVVNTPDTEIEETLEHLAQVLDDVTGNDRAFLGQERSEDSNDGLSLMEEIVLTSPGEPRMDEAPPALEPELAAAVDRLTEGVWVEMTQEGGEKLRCKVAAVIQPTGKTIFVNRRGMKVAEKTRMALAVELKRRSIAVLDESQVFDRALEAVIGNLRQMQRQPAPTV